jgi:uncharacterized protein
MIDLRTDYLEIVKRILALHVPDYDVFAFGSRVSGRVKQFSDLDLVIMSQKPLSLRKLTKLREAFSDSDLPIKVDVVDWAATDENFRAIIKRATEVVQKVDISISK